MTTYQTLHITSNIDDATEVITHTGPVLIEQSVELLRVKAIVVQHGFVTFDGQDASMRLDVGKLSASDPRDQQGKPADAFHLGGVSGRIGHVIGTGLQADLGKIGRNTRDLRIHHSVGHAVAMEKAQVGGGAVGDTHQDGWQVMQAQRVTFDVMDYTGGPNSNHAALFVSTNATADWAGDPTQIQDVVALGGVIYTKAAGVVLGACTRCGARNLSITAHYPWEQSKDATIDPIDDGNTKTLYVAA